MRKVFWICILAYHAAIGQQHEIALPVHSPTTDTIFGKVLYDPYRGLEDLNSSITTSWVRQKNQQAQQLLSGREGYQELIQEINQLSYTSPVRASVPVVNGESMYVQRYLVATDEQQVLVYRHPLDTGTVLFTTKDLTSDDHSHYRIESINPSPDNRYIAVCGYANGSDEVEIRVYDQKLKVFTKDVLDASLSYYPYWLPDSRAIFYTQLSVPNDTTDWFDHVRVKLHRLGISQELDQVILEQGRFGSLAYQSGDFPTIQVLPDSVTVRCSMAHGISQYLDYYIAPLEKILQPEQSAEHVWQPILPDEPIINAVFDQKFAYLLTSLHDSVTRIYKIPLGNLDSSVVLLSESEGYISELEARKEGVYTEVVRNGLSQLILLQEDTLQTIALPFQGDITLTSGAYQAKVSSEGIFFGLSSWNKEYGIYYYNKKENTTKKTAIRPSGPEDHLKDLVVEEVLVYSHDSVAVPLSIIYKKGLMRDGTNPVILEAYGAYGLSLEPYLELDLLPWYNRGGIVAKAHIRGGGEKGTYWHSQGRRGQKPNSWKDVIACGEYLIHQGYTSSSRLGITGNSAGGIAVGMAINERPELFGAAVLEYPFLNPIRLAASPDGEVHYEEFGNPEDATEFNYLYHMDPYMHISKGINYPAMLLTAGENDTRVALWEPAKYAAHMEAARGNDKVTLFRVYQGGHGAMGASEITRQLADKLAFFLWQLQPSKQPVGGEE